MGRFGQIIRTGALLSLLAVASHGRISTAEGMKGIRALVFSGETIREPVRIGDPDIATSLYISFRGGRVMDVDSIAMLEGRRCVTISAFTFSVRNENIALEDLPAGRGDFNYQLYLFANGVRPVMKAGERLWRITPAVAHEIAALGVPIADTTRATASCR